MTADEVLKEPSRSQNLLRHCKLFPVIAARSPVQNSELSVTDLKLCVVQILEVATTRHFNRVALHTYHYQYNLKGQCKTD